MGIDSNIIALWGASLSTILALIKIFEMWQSRRKIEVSYAFKGDAEDGNDIIIRNLSGEPFIITYWELIFKDRRAPQKKISSIEPNDLWNDLCLPAYSSFNLSFKHENYFEWGHEFLSNKKIYIKLHIAGNSRPKIYLVWK